MDGMKKINMVLFFTQGTSLQKWDQIGVFDREVALYRGLKDIGIQVSFVTYGNATDLEFADRLSGIRILCNKWNLRTNVYELFLPVLHGMWLRRADLIKTNQMRGAHLALRAARIWRKPLIARCGYMWSLNVARVTGPSSPDTARALAVERNVFSAAERMVVTTREMKEDILNRIPTSPSRVVIIPNYVETDRFKPRENKNKADKLIFVGNMAESKNLESLLQAVKHLPIHLTVIGGGKLEASLKKRFDTLNGRVKWVGNVPNSEMPGYLNKNSIFVMPSFYEGHPKAMIEAMSCGLAVIGANSPGIRELIAHGDTGLLCGTDPRSIGRAIETLLSDPELCHRLGANAREYALSHFSFEKVLKEEAALLFEVLNR